MLLLLSPITTKNLIHQLIKIISQSLKSILQIICIQKEDISKVQLRTLAAKT